MFCLGPSLAGITLFVERLDGWQAETSVVFLLNSFLCLHNEIHEVFSYIIIA